MRKGLGVVASMRKGLDVVALMRKGVDAAASLLRLPQENLEGDDSFVCFVAFFELRMGLCVVLVLCRSWCAPSAEGAAIVDALVVSHVVFIAVDDT